ncbi:MAG TPA: PTS sugar transporter subunit IIA [Chthoniobacteraceae bacterium]|jgi:mannitol/fructose-specific phosphotransferase system IIA component (Ntr-type)
MPAEEFEFSDGGLSRKILREKTTTWEVDFPAVDRRAALLAMTAAMFHRTDYTAETIVRITSRLDEREEALTTGIGFGIAIPHGVADVLMPYFGFFYSPKGVDWSAMDGRPVRLILCFILPHSSFQTHLRALKSLAWAANDASAVHPGMSLAEFRKAFHVLWDESDPGPSRN